MHSIVLTDRLAVELQPLTSQTSVALLPIAAKPLIDYTLEMLAAAGATDVTLVTGPFAEALRKYVGTGQRWGLRLACWVGRGDEDPPTLLQQFTPAGCTECLILRGDLLLTPSLLPAFLEMARADHRPCVLGVTGDRLAGLSLLREKSGQVSLLRWDRLTGVRRADVPEAVRLDLEETPVYWLDSLQAYHQANLDAAAGRIPGLNLPGREVALGLRQGRNTTLSPRSLTVGVALVGSQCRIHPTVRIAGEVVIADQVIIDRGVELTNAVILPHTYIGELVRVSHAIVRGNDLIDIETGGAINVVDAFLLADLREAVLARGFSIGVNRTGAGLLFLLSLPLWPLALLAALVENPQHPLHIRRLRGNRVERNEYGQTQRREFIAVEWATRIPPLAKLPGLWSVMTGDLRLVGVEPVTFEQAAQRTAEWELLADGSPAGLLGPTQLLLPADAPAEERLMSDAFFAGQRNFDNKMTVIWQGLRNLLRWRTWFPPSDRSPP